MIPRCVCVCSRARVICGDCLSLSASVCVLITSSSTKFLPSLCVNPISSPQTVRLMAIGAVSSRRSLLANLFPFPFSLVLSCTIYLSQPFGPAVLINYFLSLIETVGLSQSFPLSLSLWHTVTDTSEKSTSGCSNVLAAAAAPNAQILLALVTTFPHSLLSALRRRLSCWLILASVLPACVCAGSQCWPHSMSFSFSSWPFLGSSTTVDTEKTDHLLCCLLVMVLVGRLTSQDKPRKRQQGKASANELCLRHL